MPVRFRQPIPCQACRLGCDLIPLSLARSDVLVRALASHIPFLGLLSFCVGGIVFDLAPGVLDLKAPLRCPVLLNDNCFFQVFVELLGIPVHFCNGASHLNRRRSLILRAIGQLSDPCHGDTFCEGSKIVCNGFLKNL